MKIIVSAKRGTAKALVIHTVECWWDMPACRFTMVRGIYDGYYPMQVDSAVQPLELHSHEDGLRVVVATPEDAQGLSQALLDASEFCQKSYEKMQV